MSVIVVTYNNGATITQTLNSIAKQQYNNIELIITDDHSKDNTVAIANEWLQHNKEYFKNTQVLAAQENTGVAGNCNRGLSVAKGEYIKLIAGDDMLLPNYMPDMIQGIGDNDLAFCYLYLFEDENEYANGYEHLEIAPKSLKTYELSQDQLKRKQLMKNDFQVPAMLAHRSVYDSLGGYDEDYPLLEDLPFLLKCVEANKKIVFVPIYGVLYRRGQNSISLAVSQFSKKAEHLTASQRRFQTDFDRFLEIRIEKLRQFRMYRAIRYLRDDAITEKKIRSVWWMPFWLKRIISIFLPAMYRTEQKKHNSLKYTRKKYKAICNAQKKKKKVSEKYTHKIHKLNVAITRHKFKCAYKVALYRQADKTALIDYTIALNDKRLADFRKKRSYLRKEKTKYIKLIEDTKGWTQDFIDFSRKTAQYIEDQRYLYKKESSYMPLDKEERWFLSHTAKILRQRKREYWETKHPVYSAYATSAASSSGTTPFSKWVSRRLFMLSTYSFSLPETTIKHLLRKLAAIRNGQETIRSVFLKPIQNFACNIASAVRTRAYLFILTQLSRIAYSLSHKSNLTQHDKKLLSYTRYIEYARMLPLEGHPGATRNSLRLFRKTLRQEKAYHGHRPGKRLKVVLITHLYSIISSYESIYISLRNRDDVDVEFLVVPSRQPRMDKVYRYEDELIEYMEREGYSYRLGYADGQWTSIFDLEPDIVFFQTPYAEQRPPLYSPYNALAFPKISYTPYGPWVMDVSVTDYLAIGIDRPFFDILWKFFADRLTKERIAFAAPEYLPITVESGSPKIDFHKLPGVGTQYCWNLGENTEDVRRVIWLPRWGVTERRTLFMDFYQYFIDSINAFPKMDFVIRPHPLLFKDLLRSNTFDQEGLDALIAAFNSPPNAGIDFNCDYREGLLSCDFIVADFSSIIYEYLPTGKPIIYTKTDNTLIDPLIMEACYVVETLPELDEAMNFLMSGNDPLAEKRQEIVHELNYFPSDAQSNGHFIADYIATHLRAEWSQ